MTVFSESQTRLHGLTSSSSLTGTKYRLHEVEIVMERQHTTVAPYS